MRMSAESAALSIRRSRVGSLVRRISRLGPVDGNWDTCLTGARPRREMLSEIHAYSGTANCLLHLPHNSAMSCFLLDLATGTCPRLPLPCHSPFPLASIRSKMKFFAGMSLFLAVLSRTLSRDIVLSNRAVAISAIYQNRYKISTVK